MFVVDSCFYADVSLEGGMNATYFGFLCRAIFSLCSLFRRIELGDGIGGGSGSVPSSSEVDGAES